MLIFGKDIAIFTSKVKNNLLFPPKGRDQPEISGWSFFWEGTISAIKRLRHQDHDTVLQLKT